LLGGFVLSHPRMDLELSLKELSMLHIHEEIIPERVEELVTRLDADGAFIHPIIVDKRSLVVLDGMHRVAAAEEMSLRLIPVCLVDYSNPLIRIGCWYRMFKGISDLANAGVVLSESGMKGEPRPYSEAVSLVESREAITAIFNRSGCLAARCEAQDIRERYAVIREVENRFRVRGHRMGYATDKDAPTAIASGEYGAGLVTPTVTKREVLENALGGHLFSQKTTRHVIPARPMNVNVPLGWLRGELTTEEANQRLIHNLSGRRVERLPPGQFLDRRYDEELYIFR